MDPRKLFFFKMDADTLFHPHHLMPLLSALGPLARSPEEPLLLGLASCRSEHAPDLCHAAGGAGYALTLLILAPLGLLTLEENMLQQKVSFTALLVLSLQFLATFVSTGLADGSLPWVGHHWADALGNISHEQMLTT